MKKEELRIVYMGTPEFAVAPLRKLIENHFNVVGVITMPDKPAGRGHKVQVSPVKQYALDHNLPLLQPEKLKDEAFLKELKAWNADLQIVVAFRMLPEVVWNMPPKGTFNLHASLLPQYRGAAPINWAVINGETETGVTTFFLDKEIDTGKVIRQEKTGIFLTDTAGDVHDRLMQLGSEVVVQTVKDILNDAIRPVDQSELSADTVLKPAPKIFRDTCRIDWNLPGKNIYDFIRGLSPYPAAWSEMKVDGNERVVVKIFGSSILLQKHNNAPGTISTDGKSYLRVAVADGFIEIKSLQLPGKKRLLTEELLRGYRISSEFIMISPNEY